VTVLLTPILIKLDLLGRGACQLCSSCSRGLAITFYNSLLLSWWEFAVLFSLRSLFLIPLDVFKDAFVSPLSRRKNSIFYYLCERPVLHVSLDVLLLRIPSCVCYLRQSYFCYLLPSYSSIICSPHIPKVTSASCSSNNITSLKCGNMLECVTELRKALWSLL
jgi:hypothetical protein